MVRAVIVVLGLLGAAVAQYNGPAFDPNNAPAFGQSGLVYPTLPAAVPVPVPTLTDAVPTTLVTPTFIASRIPSASGTNPAPLLSLSSLSGLPLPSQSRNATMTMVSSSSVAVSSSAALSSSLSTSASRASSAAAASSSAPAQTGAAVARVPGVVGVIAGGLFAGMAML